MPSLLPVTSARTNPWKRRFLILGLLLGVVLLVAWLWHHRFGEPDDYDRMEAQFKYGSIGADHPLAQAPLPYWLWKALPAEFPTVGTLPPPQGPSNDRKGYEAFGLVVEKQPEMPRGHVDGQPTFERPIGFSKRRVLGIDFVGLNCAFCHLGTYKAGDSDKDAVQVVLGGTGNAVNIEQYFLYLFATMTSKGFTADAMMPRVEAELQRQNGHLPWWQRVLYRHVVIPVLPSYLRWMQGAKFDFIYPANPTRLPEFGPGRVDTWGLYKRVFVDPPQKDEVPGTSDFPSLWNQKARLGMRMHWDGNTDVLIERNIVSALSLVGKRIEYLDFDRLTRVTDWIVGLVPPRYSDRFPGDPLKAVNPVLSAQGQALFNAHCAQCHAASGDRIGRVEPIADLGTDAHRIAEFTPELMHALNQLGTDRWELRHFRVENGYVNMPLDGIWLRAPYLHNGSVPTLRDLLNGPDQRPKVFCRGSQAYDWKNLGYLTPPPVGDSSTACGALFRYDTRVDGNGNKGHLYGTALSDEQKAALLEFMKTL